MDGAEPEGKEGMIVHRVEASINDAINNIREAVTNFSQRVYGMLLDAVVEQEPTWTAVIGGDISERSSLMSTSRKTFQ
jgi:hypothetical protein